MCLRDVDILISTIPASDNCMNTPMCVYTFFLVGMCLNFSDLSHRALTLSTTHPFGCIFENVWKLLMLQYMPLTLFVFMGVSVCPCVLDTMHESMGEEENLLYLFSETLLPLVGLLVCLFFEPEFLIRLEVSKHPPLDGQPSSCLCLCRLGIMVCIRTLSFVYSAPVNGLQVLMFSR